MRETVLLVLGFTVLVVIAVVAALAGRRDNSVAPSLTDLLEPSLSKPTDHPIEDRTDHPIEDLVVEGPAESRRTRTNWIRPPWEKTQRL